MILRPFPPGPLADANPAEGIFVPAPDVWPWILETFVQQGAPLENPDHAHLEGAEIGVLWTSAPAVSQMRRIAGMAEIPMLRGKPWVKARQEYQIREWFGALPDFLLTFDAPFAAEADDASWCALVEHELFHCAQAVNGFGFPRWHRDGRPIFAIRGHDVEQFVEVVRRYGAGAAGVRRLVDAASKPPLLSAALIDFACGTCEGKAA